MDWEFKFIDYVKKDGLRLQFIPFENRTYAVCIAAVMNNGNALQFVPIHTREIEEIAFARSPSSIQYMRGGPADTIIPIMPAVTVISQ